MPVIRNIGKKTHMFSWPHDITLRPGETWKNAPASFATRLITENPDLEVTWEPGDVKWKTNGKVSHINYLSPFEPYDGYGIVGCNTVLNFERYGIHVSIPNPVFPQVRAQLQSTYPKVLEIIDREDRYPTKWGLCHTIPPDIDLLPTEKKILHTMWEATLVPDLWQPYMMKADALILPSPGQIPIFRDSGYDKDIFVVRDPIDTAAFPYYERPERETFTFFCWGKLTSRKEPWMILTAFSNAFPNEKNVRLVMKTRGGHFGMGRSVGIPEIRDKRIRVYDADWKLDRLLRECYNADCGIFLSTGEGSMNPPVQLMSTGVTTIGPTHSGCNIWSDPKYMYPVGLDKNEPYKESTLGTRGGKPLLWWNCSLEETIQQMRYVYTHQKEARQKGKKASKWVQQNFSIDRSMEELVSVLNKFD